MDQPTDTPPKPKAKPKPAKKPPRAGLVGPLFLWELLRLARRGQDARARFILAAALFLVLTGFSLIWFRHANAVDLFFGAAQTLTIQESATFGSSFSLAFVYGQLAILCLLTPAYAAGGIAEEKDKKTFVFLLVSDLTDREIVFGKFLGRTAFLLGVTLAGLPILAITQLHGGVSPKFLLLVYLLTACTVVLLSAVSAAAAAQAETFRGALFRAYGFTALIVIAGCGMFYPTPFLVIAGLFVSEPDSPQAFWGLGLGYPAAELLLAGFAVWVAMRSVRRLRARLTRNTPKPPPWVRDRYRDEDREKAWQEKRRREQEEARRVLAEAGPPIELTPDEVAPVPAPSANGDGPPKRLKARRVVVAQPLQTQTPSPPAPLPQGERGAEDRRWDSPRERKRKPTGYRDPAMHAAKNWTPRPKIADTDPFYWKEKHTAGAVQTEDDEAMRSMMYLIGGVLGLIVLFFLVLAGGTLVAGSESGRSSARWLLLTAGAAGVFGHLLQIGMAACGTVCRERQRLTLESLLTIPEPRRAILWPKWVVSLLRGWWWGGPAAAVMVFAFLTTDVPLAALPAAVYFAAAVPFATSYGVWLSIRCPSVNRAVMWFLPVAGFVVAFPVGVCGWADAELWWLWCGLLFAATCGTVAGGWLFWRASVTAFDVETVLGPSRG